MKRASLFLILLSLICGISVPAWADLINLGNGMIYDTELRITWLQDANYAMTSGFDADGRMNWTAANAWAAGLVVNGVSGWRLPAFDELNPSNMGPLSPLHEMEYLRRGEGITPADPGPFINMSHYSSTGDWIEPWYWTATLNSQDPARAWRFDLTCG